MRFMIQQADVANANNYVYPASVLRKILQNTSEKIAQRQLLVFYEPVEYLPIESVIGVVTEMDFDGTALFVEIEPSLMKDAWTMVENGSAGVRLCGIGSVNEVDGKDVIGLDYEMECLIVTRSPVG